MGRGCVAIGCAGKKNKTNCGWLLFTITSQLFSPRAKARAACCRSTRVITTKVRAATPWVLSAVYESKHFEHVPGVLLQGDELSACVLGWWWWRVETKCRVLPDALRKYHWYNNTWRLHSIEGRLVSTFVHMDEVEDFLVPTRLRIGTCARTSFGSRHSATRTYFYGQLYSLVVSTGHRTRQISPALLVSDGSE